MVGAEAGDSEVGAETDIDSLFALPLFRHGPPGALRGRDGLDDEAAGLRRIDLLWGKFEGLGDEVLDTRIVDHCSVVEPDVASLFTAALEVAVRIVEAGAVDEEEEADPARKKRDGEDGVGGAVGGAEANSEGVVVVVDELEGAGETGAHPAQSDAGLGGDVGSELVKEGVELGGGGWGGRGAGRGLFLRGLCASRRHGAGMVAPLLRCRRLEMKYKSPLRRAGFAMSDGWRYLCRTFPVLASTMVA